MEYNWDIKKIEKELLISKLLLSKKKIEIMKVIKSLYNIKANEFNKEDVLIKDAQEEIDFRESLDYFSDSIEYIPEDIYELILDQYPRFDKFDIFTEPKFKEVNLSNKDIVDLTHEVILSMHHKDLLNMYKYLIDPNNHLLKIQEYDKELEGELDRLGGITLRNPYSTKPYVAIFRRNTIEDVETLTHEVMHYYYVHRLYKRYRSQKVNYLTELEGQYGSLYATRYLSSLKDFKEEADLLKLSLYNSHLYHAYLLMVNQALFATSKDDIFVLKDALSMINLQLKTDQIDIYPEEIPGYLTINAYEKVTLSISFLAALDILDEYAAEYAIEVMHDLKYNDNNNLLDNLNKNGIKFHKNNLENLEKELVRIHKK